MEKEIQNGNQKINSINFCKGIAILMIIIVHSAQRFILPDWAKFITSFCQFGCQWFFLISAFTLCLSYSIKKPKYFKFILSCIKKIWFPYVCTIVLTGLLTIISILLTEINHIGSSINIIDIIINVFLLNGLFPNTANNLVVRGGWFIGTIMLFYLIFPILYKFYFYCKLKIKNWRILFPILTFLVCFLINLFIGCIITHKWFENNSFGYFFLLNQLPCLVLGFTLYDYYYDNINKVKRPIIKSFLLLILSLILYYFQPKIIFMILPYLCGLFFMYLTIFILQYEYNSNQIYKKNILSKIGKISFGIYLTHSFVVYEGSTIMKKLLNIELNNIYYYIIALPFYILICCIVSIIFMYIVKKIQILFKKIVKKIVIKKV